MFLRSQRAVGRTGSRPITSLRRKQLKRAKTVVSWVAVFGGAFALWKTLDWLDDYWKNQDAPENKEKIIVLGSGFAALSLIDSLDTTKFDVAVISPRNYFLYTPGLAESVSGSTEIESIVEPIRSFSERTKSKFTFYEANCTNIDVDNNQITCTAPSTGQSFVLPYDQLVVAVGAKNNTHNLPVETLKHVNFLNSLNDARRIRNKMLDSFEAACLPGVTDEQRAQLLSFVVVGGGPVARKVARQLSVLMGEQLRESPELTPFAKVTLVNYLDHIHNYYDHSISDYYRKQLVYRRAGVSETDDEIVGIGPTLLTFKKSDGSQAKMPFSVCVWATGSVPHPLARNLASKFPITQDNETSLIVSSSLKVLGAKNIYAIGSCSTISSEGLRATYETIFKGIDANEDGRIQFNELTNACREWGKTYPGLLEIQKRLRELFEKADENHDGCLELSEFKEFMHMVDKSLTRFPDTAAVAVQQGQFLAKQFNNGRYKEEEESEDPTNSFRYKHIGGYEYVAAENGLRERGSKGEKIITGLGAQWMYENVFFSVLVGMPMRLRMFFSRVVRLLSSNDATKL